MMALNNDAWDVFLNSNDKEILKKALKWMESVIRRNPNDANSIDTYANLLYKVGKNRRSY